MSVKIDDDINAFLYTNLNCVIRNNIDLKPSCTMKRYQYDTPLLNLLLNELTSIRTNVIRKNKKYTKLYACHQWFSCLYVNFESIANVF